MDQLGPFGSPNCLIGTFWKAVQVGAGDRGLPLGRKGGMFFCPQHWLRAGLPLCGIAPDAVRPELALPARRY